jgi:hypothetical protein
MLRDQQCQTTLKNYTKNFNFIVWYDEEKGHRAHNVLFPAALLYWSILKVKGGIYYRKNCASTLIQYCEFYMNGSCVFICNLITNAVSNSDYAVSNDYMTVNLKGCGERDILAFAWKAQNHKIPQSRQYPAQYLNQEPPKHKSKTSPFQPTCLACFLSWVISWCY